MSSNGIKREMNPAYDNSWTDASFINAMSRTVKQYDYVQMKIVVSKNWSKEINNEEQLERFIKCNSNVPLNFNMDLLKETLVELPREVKEELFSTLIPCIVDHAKEIDCGGFQNLFAKFQASDVAVELTRSEIACLLANAFLCKFPYSDNGDDNLNFTGLFDKSVAHFKNAHTVKKEKIKCILLYFRWFFMKGKYCVGSEKVIYRRNLASHQDWTHSVHVISPVLRITQQSIFEAHSMAQVDFANRRIGGGVLGNGSLQEEVRFATCPELIVARMFSKKMEDNEAIVIENFLQFCKFDGYADTFKCGGLQSDHIITQLPQTLVAMDALDFSNSGNLQQLHQYQRRYIDRELLKSYAAYSGASNSVIATGNWGGGCFKGDPILKAKIQMIAAAQAGKQLCYMTLFDDNLASDLQAVDQLSGETVGDAYKELLKFCSAKTHSLRHKT